MEMLRRLLGFRRIIGPLVPLVLFAAALWLLHGELRELRYHQIVSDLSSLGWDQISTALLLTAGSYLTLTLYDCFALAYVGERLTYWRIGLASFIGYTLSHNLGFSVFTGGAARYRLYSTWGLSPLQIAQAIAFSGLVFWLGFMISAGILLTLAPPVLPEAFAAVPLSPRMIGLLLLTAGIAGVSFWGLRRHLLTVGEWEFPAPPLRLILASLAVSALDWTLAAGVAYALLPVGQLPFLQFVGIFQLSQILGLISNVPGGLGVFETLMLLFCSGVATKSSIIGTLVVYRLTYYLLPLFFSLLLFAAYELRGLVLRVASVAEQIQSQAAVFLVPFFTFGVFLCGVVLLISGATPSSQVRMQFLSDLLPLSAVEASHFLGSITGILLILLARGLQRRLDAAYVLSLGVLTLGIVLSFTKGFDYEEALFLLAVLLLLLPCHRLFYRKASLLSEPLSPMWFMSIGLVFITTAWLIFFRYKHLEYSTDLWWEFSFLSDAPRSLRATVGAFAIALGYGIGRILAPSDYAPHTATREELERALPILSASRDSCAALALLGDKSLLFSGNGKAFIMYAVDGQSWVALSDPVGDPSEFPELIWRFRELSDQYGGSTVFYQVSARNLQYYVETGLEFIKLGEEAIVALKDFHLDGKAKANLRHSRNKVRKDGFSFRVVPAEQIEPLLPRLREISDYWLKEKNTREKGFSLGFYHESYLLWFPVAVAEKGGEVVAFANIWPGDGHTEVSVDLMRYGPEAPGGVMDFLFIELMLWGKERGYERFNLGMAPFSGFEEHKLAPLWNKLGRVLYQHGERYYNFQGLRHYKEKFGPEWEPRFLAAPGGFGLARVITNVASLISGGLRGIVTK